MDPTFIITLIILILCFIGLSWFAGSDAPYVPTTSSDLAKALKESGIEKNKVFYELGSGDGRVVLQAAKMGALAHGVEQSWIRVWYSRFKAKKLKLEDALFFHGDIFHRHYYPADIVYIYLLNAGVAKLEKKLRSELKKGTIIITQTYHFPNWKPFKKIGQFWLYKK